MKDGHRRDKPESFHERADQDLVFWQHPVVETTTKRVVLQERGISYRFHPHFHPYVGELVRRLLRGGTASLQAADTEYVPGASLPGSVELALDGASRPALLGGSPATVLVGSSAALPDGTWITLEAGLELRTAVPARATLPDGSRLTLTGGLAVTPSPGAEFSLDGDEEASPPADTRARLEAAVPITLTGGRQAVLKAGTEVLLPAGTTLIVPGGTKVRLLKSDPLPALHSEIFTEESYGPSPLVRRPHPVDDLDFAFSGAYSAYNWELFFHIPLTIAVHLSKNQRFAEAQSWFHHLFDPTDDSDGPTPERFWKVRPFQRTDVKKTEELLVNLATGNDPALREETVRSIEVWNQAPFRPHAIARYRQQAYMYKTVMAYLDNLIAWGDALFRQDTGESVDEALMLYVLAADILGPRPQAVPAKGSVRPQTYHALREDLGQFGTALRNVEADVGFDLMPFPAQSTAIAGEADRQAAVRGLGKALYFHVPRNDRLLGYWDTVADRLFKIRNSLDLQGTFRRLALFEPPVDPALLARATAAGLDVAAVVGGLDRPLPLVRFPLLVQKAAELCQEVKALGASLLTAMEKEDGEVLAVLRARHERTVLELSEAVKYGQVQEAVKAREGLLASLALAAQRYTFYERQLGRDPEEIKNALPELDDLDAEGLAGLRLTLTEPEVGPRDIEVDIATDAFAQAARLLNGGRILSSHEVRETLFLEGAQLAGDAASVLNSLSSAAAVVPQFEVSAKPWGMGASTHFGGQNISAAIQSLAHVARGAADRLGFEARRASRIDGFARREREWALQSNLAAGEMNQIFKQLRAAQLREAVARRELESHRRQMRQAGEMERFLNAEGVEKDGKTTNRALYAWMKREVRGLYAQSFELAFEAAGKAERALRHELGDPDLRYLQSGYLSGKEGLLAGERLHLDLRRMELAYHDLNQREYELTKHISLLQVDPLALIELRATGRCTVRLPEELFDLDGPGHYFRRIKTVAVSVPCVVGPYASVNCTLTLLKSTIRITPVLREGEYRRENAEDDRFSDHFGGLQSVVVSSAGNDAGLFETGLRDERYLPFEYCGAISEWRLELPADPRAGDPCQFDYDTISDVVLHLRYTAREGGGALRLRAAEHLKELMPEGRAPGSVRLFSVRHEFPAEWARFLAQQPTDEKRAELALTLLPEHFPFWSRGRLDSVRRVEVLCRSSKDEAPTSIEMFSTADRDDPEAKVDPLTRSEELGGLMVGAFSNLELPAQPDDELRISFDVNAMADLWIALTWSA